MRSDERGARYRRRDLSRKEHGLPLHAATDGLLRHHDGVAGTELGVERFAAPQSLARTDYGSISANHENCFLVSELGRTAGLAQVPLRAFSGPVGNSGWIEDLAGDHHVA